MFTIFMRWVIRSLRLLLLGMLISMSFISPLAADLAQSIFRLNPKPEFMLLSVYSKSPVILGFTVSLWELSYKSVIVGTHLGDAAIELSFYPARAYERALKAARRSETWPHCKPGPRSKKIPTRMGGVHASSALSTQI